MREEEMALLPGLRPVALVTLQVGGVSLRAGLVCDTEDFAPGAVESFVLLLHRCTHCMFTCAERSHMTAHLSSAHLSPAHISPTHSPAHMISPPQEFMQTDKEDEDLFLYDMFDISTQGAELQETHTCQVSSLFEEHCSLFKEETDQSAHLRTLGLCPAPKSPPTTPPTAPCRTSTGTKEETRRRSRSRTSRVRLRSTKTGSDPPPVQAQSTAPRPAQDFRSKSQDQPQEAGPKHVRDRRRRKNLQKEHFICSVCNRSFSSALTLRRHAGVHSDLRPFSCSFCPFSSRLRASVQQHQRTHTGERPFRCSVCSYASIDRSSLLRHQRVHNNERPHCCPHCDYSSIQKKSLDLHLQRHHHVPE